MKVSFYRVFVEKAAQLSLLEDKSVTKQNLLSKVFNVEETIYVVNGKQRFAYRPIRTMGDYIIARLAKQSVVSVEHSPEENFTTERVESWPSVIMIINTSPDPQIGQSIAIEVDKQVFKNPSIQLRELSAYFNKATLHAEGYETIINPITIERDFWKLIRQKTGEIRSLTFELAAPNLFGTQDALNDELREAQKDFGITSATFKLENSEGNLRVPEENSFLQQGVKYVSDGGGSYTIKTKYRKTISSQDSTATSTIEEAEVEAILEDAETAKDYCDKLFLWLKQRD